MRNELCDKLAKMNIEKAHKVREELSRLHRWESSLTVRFTHHKQTKFWNNLNKRKEE